MELHVDMVTYSLDLSAEYAEWDYADSIMHAAASEKRWEVIAALEEWGLSCSWTVSGARRSDSCR